MQPSDPPDSPDSPTPAPISQPETLKPTATVMPIPTPAPLEKPKGKRGVYILLAILIVLLVGLTIWRVVQLHRQKQAAATTHQTTVATPTPATVAPTSGSDNQSLNNDLTTVSNGLNSENQAQTAATSAVNDQQQEVNVPTN